MKNTKIARLSTSIIEAIHAAGFGRFLDRDIESAAAVVEMFLKGEMSRNGMVIRFIDIPEKIKKEARVATERLVGRRRDAGKTLSDNEIAEIAHRQLGQAIRNRRRYVRGDDGTVIPKNL